MYIVDVEYDGLTTVVQMAADGDSYASAMNPELIGIGVARCRPEDHYEADVGLDIASARAAADLARQHEERALRRSLSEIEYGAEPMTFEVVLPSGERYTKVMPRVIAEELAEFASMMLGAKVNRE